MSYSISKELFEAVMGFEVIEFYCRKEIQYYPADKERVRCLNWVPVLNRLEYNDFFFKCKEWATKKCIWISSWNSNDLNNPLGLCEVGHCVKGKIGMFESLNEQQAVFDACQWILDNKDRQ